MNESLHILILADRDWTHPEAGGTGANLYGQVSRWIAWGHRVTVIAGAYEGAEPLERPHPRLELHHMGTRLTVFPKAIWAVLRRGVGRDADVAIEVVNGISFFAPLWLRKPRVALVHHVHRAMYVTELGRRGAIAAWLLETLPLKLLYRSTPVLTISDAARTDLLELGLPRENIHVAYLGVDPAQFHEAPKAERPTLLYLGRLKQYKRIEYVLDMLESLPEAVLDIAGEGDHRPALEAEIARRGLTERVRMHGHVDDRAKCALYARAWLVMTASSAEGWCLTVMEAAACGTPCAALRVGGLAEAIEDGRTGALADTRAELIERAGAIMADAQLRERLGAAARARARSYTWERTAEDNMRVLERTARVEPQPLRAWLGASETVKAAGLAAATVVANGLALAFTIVFARLLGADGYGSLAALVSTFLILSVPGSALQVAAARETALGRLGSGPALAATLERWTRALVVTSVAIVAFSIVMREPLAALVGVEEAWAAAATLPTGCLWLMLSLERGVLQGLHAYKPVGASIILEACGRLVFGLILVGGGLEVTGAYLGTPLAMLLAALVLALVLRRRTGSPDRRAVPHTLRELIGDAWAPVAALTLIAVLQNIDVIIVKHQLDDDAAGSYAAAAVAAKALIWVAIGVGLYLLPEAARRMRHGQDARPVLLRALAVITALGIPLLAVFGLAPTLVLKLAFGAELTQADDALFLLTLAFTLLAAGYLAVQYMLALGRIVFLPALAVVAVLEPILLSAASESILGVAAVVLALQCVAAAGVLALSFRRTPVRVS